ncbi:MAG: hypothetical protein JXR84_13040 [Anaerolineae bacterium]|nr:hypothetical protein [Anaerolineae bacterium]
MPHADAAMDPEDLAAIVEDLRRCVAFVRQAEGYGEVTVRLQVRPQGFAGWEVSPVVSRKPRRETAGSRR